MAVMVASMKRENKDGRSPQQSASSPAAWLNRLHARCDGPQASHVSVLPTEPIKRANPQKLRDIFNKYASEVKDGNRFMKYGDFVQRYLGLLDFENYNEQTLSAIGLMLDINKTGLISFEAFQEFEGMLCQPDALYRLAFRFFDTQGTGFLDYKAFETLLKQTNLYKFFPFNFDSDFVKLHFGKKKERRISYEEFTQVLWEYHEEHALQAFNKYDADNTGYITMGDFKNILENTVPHLMTSFVRASIPTMVHDQYHVSYAYFKAFVSLLNNMELFKKIYTTTTKQSLTKDVYKWEFLQQAQHFTQVTPLEVNILYQLVALLHPDGKLNYRDLEALAPLDIDKMPYRIQARVISEAVEDLKEVKGRSYLMQIFESSYRFGLGSIAGAVGATAVYPIDLVKTRMQNQRVGTMVGELLYKNSFDCFKKVLRFEGFFGLYRGLTPQLIGVAPEKAIKLTVNDLVRDKTTGADGSLPLWAEILAGGCAGGSQVVFTNPLEIVKIRLQVAGEIATSVRPSAISVIKDLGFFGLYKGAKACFLRDIPFSAIYFPVYAHMKKYLADESGYNKPSTLFVAALTAGVPAASLVTPADVIKTRLQVQARKGQTTYSGLVDCAAKIWREEGGRAFWKGAGARVFRSSPQFGVTLLTYEMLQRAFYVDFGGRRLEGSHQATATEVYQPQNADHVGGYRFVRPTFDGVETRFGLCLPRFKNA